MREKPILFNTEMVKAILEGRKTQTRRIIKPRPHGQAMQYGRPVVNPPVEPGDILWVRETWKQATTGTAGPGLIDLYLYKADEPQDTTGMMVEDRWHPSIHMPRIAARVFLKVTAVRAERIQDITHEDVLREGIDECNGRKNGEDCACAEIKFKDLWDSTIKKADIPESGWNANPWVWVIEFERTERGKTWT